MLSAAATTKRVSAAAVTTKHAGCRVAAAAAQARAPGTRGMVATGEVMIVKFISIHYRKETNE
jgi:hypothetical protein